MTKFAGLILILEEKGNLLREPYSKHLEDGIFELCGKVGTDIARALYFFYCNEKIVFINGFIKKTQKTTRSEIVKAKEYRKDYIERSAKMRKFDDFLQEQLQDEEFRKEYENMQPEFDVIRAIIDARISQNLTQKELAEKTGIHQADISKLENGTRNPSIKLLKRLAKGMDMVLKIEFIPKQKI